MRGGDTADGPRRNAKDHPHLVRRLAKRDVTAASCKFKCSGRQVLEDSLYWITLKVPELLFPRIPGLFMCCSSLHSTEALLSGADENN